MLSGTIVSEAGKADIFLRLIVSGSGLLLLPDNKKRIRQYPLRSQLKINRENRRKRSDAEIFLAHFTVKKQPQNSRDTLN